MVHGELNYKRASQGCSDATRLIGHAPTRLHGLCSPGWQQGFLCTFCWGGGLTGWGGCHSAAGPRYPSKPSKSFQEYIVDRTNKWDLGTFGSAVPKVPQYLFAAMVAQGTSQPRVDYYLVNRSGCRGGPASRRSWDDFLWERHGPELRIRSSLVMIDDHSQTCFVSLSELFTDQEVQSLLKWCLRQSSSCLGHPYSANLQVLGFRPEKQPEEKN